jgi:glucosamine 6-phosphate synthetase-like amidotransferase/phosphosugar isomerase protein
MCGLIYAKRTDLKLAKKLILKRYEKQKTRGRDGFGFIEIKDGIVGNEFRSEEEKDIKTFLNSSESDEILFHHRFPTSTPNFIESTHPIKISHESLIYDYYVVHNGVISNDSELKTKHNEQGFKYTTEILKQYVTSGNTYTETMWNDSEAFAIDLCQSIETGKNIESKGSIAFIALQYDKVTNKEVALYFGRNEKNPLKIEFSDYIFCLSSESGREIKANQLNRYDCETNVFTTEEKNIGVVEVYNWQNNYKQSDFGFKHDGKDKWNDLDDDIKKLEDKKIKDTDSYYQAMQDLYDDIELLEDDIRQAKLENNYDELLELQFDLEDKQEQMQTLYNVDYKDYG